ncbi:MAG: hypothetical protein V1859_06430 [archaeon]
MFVSNTSTLILLAKIGLLRKFLEGKHEVIIPQEVYIEFIEKENSFDAKLIKKEIDEKRIYVKTCDKKIYSNILREFRLHEGEAAAYSLFDVNKHKAILTDDGELIKLCRLSQIPFVCSMAIVINLYKNEKITKAQAKEKIDMLFTIGRYSKDIYEYFIKEVS